ncbi:MAG: hypothetical protein ACYSRR_04390 [Planctomycetota bacterium]|jgi:hypothetical protein
MKRNSHVCFGGAGLLALFFFILQTAAFAGMAVSPLQQWVEVKPGKTTTFLFSASNNNRGPATIACTVNVDLLDFTVSPQGKISFGPEHKHPRSAVDWISSEEDEIVLEPGESREIKFKVSAPLNADGDYWAAAMVGLGKPRDGEKGVQVKLRTASGIFIHVAKRNYIERGSVIEANVNLPEFDTTNNLTEKIAAEPASDEIKKEQVLKINAELKNDGLVAFLARGKAYLYSDGWRRVATIPLHASRRRVLPGDSRWFTGVMAQPLPAGQYKLRTFFASDSKYRRKMTRDMEFAISGDLAGVWAKNFVSKDTQMLEIKPQQIDLKLNPGRLTAARFQVFNQSSGTIVTNCRVESNNNDWLELKTGDFTLAPGTQRSTTCIVKVPSDALPGQYNWTIHVETERSGLTTQKQNNIEQHQIPVCVVIDENIPTLASRQK